MISYDLGPGSKSLLIWAYAIGCFDLLVALLFTVVALRMICRRLSWLIIFAILFGIFWLSMIWMLLLGIHGRNPRLVRSWLIFSFVSILAEIFLFLFGILSQSCYQQGLVRNGILLMMALVVEFIFLYIIHRFYLTLCHCDSFQRGEDEEPQNQDCQSQKGSDSSLESQPITHHTSLANPIKLSSMPTNDRHPEP